MEGKILGYYSFFCTALGMDMGTTPALSVSLDSGRNAPVLKLWALSHVELDLLFREL